MKTFRLIRLSLVAVLLLVLSAAAQEKPWIDMENCAFCKCLTEDPHLLENMSWEYHDIDNGLMIVTAVAPEFKESYLKAQKAMEALAMQMASGKTDIKTCGHCDYFGHLMAVGAHFENIQSKVGHIMLITSEKPEVLDMIREFARRNREELAKKDQGR
jgi:hypothetical protein